MNEFRISRRELLGAAAVGAAGLAAAGAEGNAVGDRAVVNGRINQSVCKWCYGRMSVAELAAAAARMGLKGMDLVGPGDWPVLKEHGLVGTMCPSHGIGKGLNRRENWDECLASIRSGIDACAEWGFPNVICFSGNREGMDDDEGMRNCAEALKQVAGYAEQKGVTICMELLNSKRDHKDYMCDRTPWGVEMCKLVGSPRVKLLYDIYHMQIDEGDVIATIRQYHEYIGHYHTGGVPGRHEIDETQELYYPAIMKAILDTGFTGWVAHEFIPARDPVASLTAAAKLCDV